ncbi:hypothetical protein [Radiobacillus sp. PE A8.2]|uniref:hypothetical protein n=1 Tax=Radiobacillus sp. PE A8.2 TaxID=3380349 RepID=UPI00388F174B
MRIVPAVELGVEQLELFFEDKWEQLDGKQTLLEYGYVIEFQGKNQAFFALSPVAEQSYWLKRLYIKDKAPTSLPLAIIEAAITLAQEKYGDHIYVYSHITALDALLEALQFSKLKTSPFDVDVSIENGNWWNKPLAKRYQINGLK